MKLASELDCVASFPLPDDFSVFAKDVDPAWIDQALAATGTAAPRRRRLPAEQVPWLVIGNSAASQPADHRGRQQARPGLA